MAEKLTPQQRLAVENTGGRLLVSAAAGSGKTKVLVDRLLGYILDPVHPANLDDFLIITYTKAAAAELRGKIAAKLTEALAQAPENRHLQKQMQRLYLTKISTVHAFCADLLREYAYRLELPGDFRVADENECAQLRETVMNRMLESLYESSHLDPDFCAFVDAQGLGRNDKLVPEILMKVYNSAKCHLVPQRWLQECIDNTDTQGKTDVSQTTWGMRLMESLHSYLSLQIQAMKACQVAAETSSGMEKPAALLADTVQQLQRLYQASTWEEILACKDIDFGKLVISSKCEDQELAQRIKAVRKACIDGVRKRIKWFSDPSSQVLIDIQGTLPSVRGIVALVRRFDAEYSNAKLRRRILDFSDLEHKTLDLLLGKERKEPTAIAREVSENFREILVDEYQDSNAVQDAIFTALTQQRQNCFMVGDVKQSIYQFRLADPGIFLKKYADYAPAEDAQPMQGRKVTLCHNFRSGGEVLSGINDVFSLCMSPQVGGLYYDEEQALHEGIPHEPLGEAAVELLTLDVDESTYEEEARLVANRVWELIHGEHFVRGKDGKRRIQPEDIAILLRSPGSVGGYFTSALQARGIRCVSGGGEDLLKTQEVSTLRSLLQLISNPWQDIPLIAVLASPVFGFTADDLAAFRSQKRYGTVYDSLLLDKGKKAEEFFSILNQLRLRAKLGTLAQLICEIFRLTKMDSIFGAMDNGGVRLSNLHTFYGYACSFPGNGAGVLEQFLEHLDSIAEKGLITQGEDTASGAVTLMSIHKSKGLEFPVVFVSGLSRNFNRESSRAHILCDQDLGLGLSVVDSRLRIRYPTVAKRAIGEKILEDSLSEEMRVLYVALTRARDRLIMTYASQTLEKDLLDISLRMDLCDSRLLTMDAVCPGEWVLMTALRRTEAGELFQLASYPDCVKPGNPPWRIRVLQAQEPVKEFHVLQQQSSTLPEDVLCRLKEGLAFSYPYIEATKAPSKQTATQRKGRDKDGEVSQHTREEMLAHVSFRKPSFVQQDTNATLRGNSMHLAMQYLDFSKCSTLHDIEQELVRLTRTHRLDDHQSALVDVKQIHAFFQTELGKKLISGQKLLREFKFSILDNGDNYHTSLVGEKILLQGVVDCAVIEDAGITLLDFKTDALEERDIPQRVSLYTNQVLAYAEALSRIFEKPILGAFLYFFRLNRLEKIM